jgi:hypothetical protein
MKTRLVLIALLLVPILFIDTPESGAWTQDQGWFWHDKGNYGSGYVNTAYRRAFGRNATAAEMEYWSRRDVSIKFDRTGDNPEEASQNALVTEIKKYLGKPEGAAELRATIERSYRGCFNREPTPQDLAYWQSECKARNMGFEDLVRAHGKWLQSPQGEEYRNHMVLTVYPEVYGRPCTQKERDYWMAELKSKGYPYVQLRKFLFDWMLGSGKEQVAELENTIRRAYTKASLPPPNAEQLKTAMTEESAKKYMFAELVDYVKKTNPAAASTPVKVPSFKRQQQQVK